MTAIQANDICAESSRFPASGIQVSDLPEWWFLLTRIFNMSNKERIIELLNIISDYKMGYVLAYVQGIVAVEETDGFFFQRMVENYENAPDENEEGIPFEECLKEGGLD